MIDSILLSNMQKRHEEREKMYTTKLVETFSIPSRARLSELGNETVVLGTYSHIYQKSGVREMLKRYCIKTPWGLDTPTAIARDYLRCKYPEFRKIFGRQAEVFKQLPQPLYAEPRRMFDAAYVDVRSAYWSIIKAVGWNVDYMPGHFMGVRSNNFDFPYPDHKVCRNVLASACLPTMMKRATQWGIENRATYNVNLNLGLHMLIQHILHGVAHEALGMGARYFNTDGCILPARNADDFMERIRDGYGLETSIKMTGQAIIFGVGSYIIGTHRTARLVRPHAHSNLNVCDDEHMTFAKFRFQKWAHRRLGE